MTQSINLVSRAREILIKIYRDYQARGEMSSIHKQYFNGFVDAASLSGELSPTQLDKLIDEANLTVFGMTLAERKALSAIEDDPSLLDKPACERNRKSSDVLVLHLKRNIEQQE